MVNKLVFITRTPGGGTPCNVSKRQGASRYGLWNGPGVDNLVDMW